MKKLSVLILFLLITGMQLVNAQGIIVSGRTTDQKSGAPLQGVTVLIKGTTIGAISAADGTYSLTAPDRSASLVFSFIGYQVQEVPIGDRTVINVVMEEETTTLSEVVVTGYSMERKRDIIGSVAVANMEEMLSTPSGSVTTQLQGRVAGLMVSTDGSLDNAAKIRVRGFGSFQNSNPLYIIDGVPGGVNNLNPNDIESLQVLKDAASAAVYGARAANGVIIITTRQGKKGAPKFTLDAYSGINYVSSRDFPDLLDTEEWALAYWKSMEGAGRTYGEPNWTHPQFGDGPTPVIPEYILVNDHGSMTGGFVLEKLKVSDPALFAATVDPARYDLATYQIVKSANTDWFAELYNPAPVNSVQLSASGGSDNGRYAVGLSYFNQENTANAHGYYTRYTLRANTALDIRKWFTIGENIQVSYNETIPQGGNASSAWTMPSIVPVYDVGGGPASSAPPMVVSVGTEVANPITQNWRNRFDKNYNYRIFGNAYIDLKPIKDLILHSSFGIDYDAGTSMNLTQVTYEHSLNTPPPNSLIWGMDNSRSWTFTNTATYSKELGSHQFKILAGTEAIQDYYKNVSATRENLFIDNDENYLVLNAGTGNQSSSGSFSRAMLFSLIGRFDYSFAGKYLLNATIRRDGSSKFGINNRYGHFPSVAVGWRITDEKFMQGLRTWLYDMKLRASYGIIGNQSGLANANQFSTIEMSLNNSYPLAGSNTSITQSYFANRLGNPNARWEKSTSTNLGFDAILFKGATTINFDYYMRKTVDLLVAAQAPYTGMNITQPAINVGDIQNKGVDITITQRSEIAGQVGLEISGSFSAYKNEVLKVLDNPKATLAGGNTRMGDVCLTRQGNPISFFYGYQTEGFYNTQEEVDEYIATHVNNIIPAAVGRWRITDISGPNGVPDTIINDYDRTMIGDPHPDFQVGLNLTLTYRGFDFSGFVFWNQGGDLFNYARYYSDFQTFQTQRSHEFLYDSWTPAHKDALLPKLDLQDTYSNKYVTSYFIEDATYVRLKNLQLGYSVPSGLLDKINVARARIYVQAQNLFTAKKFSGLDPGMSISGGDLSMGVVLNNLPTPKQVLVGVNIDF
jgi:TonB-linked SusC/RagA family outer membrane protein